MLGVILKIVSILGWFLAVLLLLLVLILLLALVYPVGYRLRWEKNGEGMTVSVKASWLLGLLKVRYEYPVPGTVVAKLLGFTVYDSGKTQKEPDPKEKDSDADNSEVKEQEKAKSQEAKRENAKPEEAGKKQTEQYEEKLQEAESGIIGRIRKILENIFNKIRQICDTIRYYLDLLREEDTGEVVSKLFLHSGKILKNIRPRKIKGQILLGTGSPDTTGYAMAVYGMLSPFLGQNLILTPDFENKVLEGQLFVKGRIMAGVLLFHVLKVALEGKVRLFFRKLKREVG